MCGRGIASMQAEPVAQEPSREEELRITSDGLQREQIGAGAATGDRSRPDHVRCADGFVGTRKPASRLGGDTYFQSVSGQSFDIMNVPNGTYYIEVVANPEKLLYETTTSNDISLRELILGGTRGHRTVQVPAWNGIDPGG